MAIAPQKLNKFIWGLVFIASIFQMSCQIEPGFEENSSLGAGGWPEKQQLIYDIPQVAETGMYQLDVLIRQDNNYPFYNCYFVAEVNDSKGNSQKKD